jgi:death on curing protein
MNWVLLNVEAIEKVHSDLIDQYGGSHGLRDAGLLESAVQRAENKIYFQPESTVAMVAASVSYGLIKNHAFIDGNKRIGLAVLVDFLRLNGYRLLPPNKEQVAMVQQTAASQISEEEWTAWVERSVALKT